MANFIHVFLAKENLRNRCNLTWDSNQLDYKIEEDHLIFVRTVSNIKHALKFSRGDVRLLLLHMPQLFITSLGQKVLTRTVLFEMFFTSLTLDTLEQMKDYLVNLKDDHLVEFVKKTCVKFNIDNSQQSCTDTYYCILRYHPLLMLLSETAFVATKN